MAESPRLFRACEVTEAVLLLLLHWSGGGPYKICTCILTAWRLSDLYFYFESSESVIALLLKSIVYQIYA